MRKIYRTKFFDEFYDGLSESGREKVEYVLFLLTEMKIIHSKFVKKLIDTEFYELRVSADNEYRIIVFPVNADNVIQATEVVLLNGFIKKSTKDYKGQIIRARSIVNSVYEGEE